VCSGEGSPVRFSFAFLDEILGRSRRVPVFHDRRLFADAPTSSLNPETLAGFDPSGSF
jgi:hypothetical protein